MNRYYTQRKKLCKRKKMRDFYTVRNVLSEIALKKSQNFLFRQFLSKASRYCVAKHFCKDDIWIEVTYSESGKEG